MSIWTHIAGVARFDCLRFSADEPLVNWDSIFGKEIQYEDDWGAWCDYEANSQNYMPAGSEGSLQKTIWENPDMHCIASYTVTVFGDLRDYDSADDIIEWFKKALANSGLPVRNAVIVAETECGKPKTYVYGGNDE